MGSTLFRNPLALSRALAALAVCGVFSSSGLLSIAQVDRIFLSLAGVPPVQDCGGLIAKRRPPPICVVALEGRWLVKNSSSILRRGG